MRGSLGRSSLVAARAGRAGRGRVRLRSRRLEVRREGLSLGVGGLRSRSLAVRSRGLVRRRHSSSDPLVREVRRHRRSSLRRPGMALLLGVRL